MTIEDKFRFIINNCKASVTIECNPHKDYYQTVKEYLDDFDQDASEQIDVDEKIDSLFVMQAYPLTPIGFYKVYSNDLDGAINKMFNYIQGAIEESPDLYL